MIELLVNQIYPAVNVRGIFARAQDTPGVYAEQGKKEKRESNVVLFPKRKNNEYSANPSGV